MQSHISSRDAAGDNSVSISLAAKRKGMTITGNSNEVATAAAHGALLKRVVSKAPSELAFIISALASNSLFAALSDAERADIADAMDSVQIAAGVTFIREGDEGDALYAIETGRLDILKGGAVVAEWGESSTRRIVGELALLYGVPRSASVRASTNVRAWRITHKTFQMTMAAGTTTRRRHVTAALRTGLLAGLNDDQLAQVAAAAEQVSFPKGAQIIAKGDPGDAFYLIEKGSVVCRNLPGELRDNTLTAGDYFGERSLLKQEPRVCDVWAAEDVSLIALHREDFTALLGPVKGLLEHNLGMRLLLCVPLFARLAPEDLTTVFSTIRLLHFKQGSHILVRGSSVTQLLIIKVGKVAVTGSDGTNIIAEMRLRQKISTARARASTPLGVDGRPDKRRLTPVLNMNPAQQDVLTEGQWFGEDEVETTAASPFTYTAMESVVAFSVDRDTFALHLAPLLRTYDVRPSSAAMATAASSRFGENAQPKPSGGQLPPPRARLGYPLKEFEQR